MEFSENNEYILNDLHIICNYPIVVIPSYMHNKYLKNEKYMYQSKNLRMANVLKLDRMSFRDLSLRDKK